MDNQDGHSYRKHFLAALFAGIEEVNKRQALASQGNNDLKRNEAEKKPKQEPTLTVKLEQTEQNGAGDAEKNTVGSEGQVQTNNINESVRVKAEKNNDENTDSINGALPIPDALIKNENETGDKEEVGVIPDIETATKQNLGQKEVGIQSEQIEENGAEDPKKNTGEVQTNSIDEPIRMKEKSDEANNRNLMEGTLITPDGFINENEKGVEEVRINLDNATATTETEKEKESQPKNVSSSKEKFIITKRKTEDDQTCAQCALKSKGKYVVSKGDTTQYICHDNCLENFQRGNADCVLNCGETPIVHERRCFVCKKKTGEEENLTWEIKDFCNEFCLSKHQKKICSVCVNCKGEVPPNSLGKYCVRFGTQIKQLCSSQCLQLYKNNHKVCSYCQRIISGGFRASLRNEQSRRFCTQTCLKKYSLITSKQPKIPKDTKCSVCRSDSATIEYCSVQNVNYFCDSCFVTFSFINSIASRKCSMCLKHFDVALLEENTVFYNNMQRSFCSAICQNIYIAAHGKIVPCDWCKVRKYHFDMIGRYFNTGHVLNLCSINCLNFLQVSINAVHSKKTTCNFCNKYEQPMYHFTMSDATIRNFCSYPCVASFQKKFQKFPEAPEIVISQPSVSNTAPQVAQHPQMQVPANVKHQIIIKCAPLPEQRNTATMCTVTRDDRATTVEPNVADRGVQTDQVAPEKVLVPVPLYIPTPLPMYSIPIPYPIPFPLSIPVPLFIPTTLNSAKKITKDVKEIRDRIPNDPYESELLMMAAMVANDETEQNCSLDNEVLSPELDVNTFDDDILQMALEIATQLEAEQSSERLQIDGEGGVEEAAVKRRKTSQTEDNMKLKYLFGVNAWKQWVTSKNARLEEAGLQPFKTDMLELTAQELNYCLCLFVREVCKPNGDRYAPDTVYYLCLGIQHYLSENGRIDKIFTDPQYEQFTDSLDGVARNFLELYDSHYIVTRIEEEHLWESKQLGAHSPRVLLNTLLFFNTKYFHLTTVEEHEKLSFSHIIKHFKRVKRGKEGVSKLKQSSLSYYPPHWVLEKNPDKKRVYEQQRNNENPLRCPVSLYEFYLSKCLESVKGRNDVFYLQPERSCVPESPIWYSTEAVSQKALEKMLHRVKMVKEVNVALLAS